MKNWVIVGIGSVLGIFTLLIFWYIGLIIYINWPNDRPIAKNLKITQEWTEITVDPPLKPNKIVQEINLRIDNFREDRNSNNFEIKLPDGTVIDPELEIYDENGNKFEFHHSGFVMKWYDDVE